MKKLLPVCLLVLAAFGCQSPDRRLMEALNRSWLLLEPYCLTGIAHDSTLDADEREIRNRQVDEFRLALLAGLDASRGALQTSDDPPPSQSPSFSSTPGVPPLPTTTAPGVPFPEVEVNHGE